MLDALLDRMTPPGPGVGGAGDVGVLPLRSRKLIKDLRGGGFVKTKTSLLDAEVIDERKEVVAGEGDDRIGIVLGQGDVDPLAGGLGHEKRGRAA